MSELDERKMAQEKLENTVREARQARTMAQQEAQRTFNRTCADAISLCDDTIKASKSK